VTAARLTAALAGCLAVLSVAASTATAESGGNASAAKLCQKGGYEQLAPSGESAFSNQGACVSYAARGGSLGASAPFLTLTPFSPGLLAMNGGGLQPGAPISICNSILGTACSEIGNISGDGTFVGTISCFAGEYLESTTATGDLIDSNPAGSC
jgi:hypothetical protein